MLGTLVQVQNTLNAPKSQRNDFSNFNYRSCETILEAVKPLLSESNLELILTDEIILIGDRYYVKSTARLISFVDSISKVVAEVHGFAREEPQKKGMDAAQITGSASSYARKYALCGLFLIDGESDPDSRDNSVKAKKEDAQYSEEAAILRAACASKDGDLIKKTYSELKKDSVASVWAALSKDDQEFIRGML